VQTRLRERARGRFSDKARAHVCARVYVLCATMKARHTSLLISTKTTATVAQSRGTPSRSGDRQGPSHCFGASSQRLCGGAATSRLHGAHNTYSDVVNVSMCLIQPMTIVNVVSTNADAVIVTRLELLAPHVRVSARALCRR
jgi:hypothetical protein